MHKKMTDLSDATGSWVCILLIIIGIVLIIASWAPIGHVVSRAMWTREDSASYSELRQQIHGSAYQSTARTQVTEAQTEVQPERLRIQAEAMRKKLEHARQQSLLWSEYSLWSGSLLTAIGALCHLAGRKRSRFPKI